MADEHCRAWRWTVPALRRAGDGHRRAGRCRGRGPGATGSSSAAGARSGARSSPTRANPDRVTVLTETGQDAADVPEVAVVEVDRRAERPGRLPGASQKPTADRRGELRARPLVRGAQAERPGRAPLRGGREARQDVRARRIRSSATSLMGDAGSAATSCGRPQGLVRYKGKWITKRGEGPARGRRRRPGAEQAAWVRRIKLLRQAIVAGTRRPPPRGRAAVDGDPRPARGDAPWSGSSGGDSEPLRMLLDHVLEQIPGPEVDHRAW